MFDYDAAFSRNLGWVTEAEQQQLRHKCIAIAGLGGVGGSHLLTLARLGIGKFKLADFDTFDTPNFNRQAGAMMSTLGQPKVEVLARMAKDINPELEITSYPAGIDDNNLDDFLDGVDLYVDSLDFFAFKARRNMFAACAAKGIPAITAAPLGMGTAMLIFMPGRMTFEEYFQLEGHDEFEQGIRFLLGLAPARLHNRYLVEPQRIDLANRKGPSTGMACQLCAGVAATNALKILLGRGDVITAPRGLHFDAYNNMQAITHLPNGNKGWLQRIKIHLAKTMLSKQHPQTDTHGDSVDSTATPIERVLDLARWAPSGDNTQVWRFQLHGPNSCTIVTHDTRDEVVYDFEGRPSQLAVGALLETVRIAASKQGLRADIRLRPVENDRQLLIDVELHADSTIQPDPLADSIKQRSVQRRPLATTALTEAQQAKLQAAIGDQFRVIWFDNAAQRKSIAKLLFANAKIRLTIPEAFEVHRKIIDWNKRYSQDKVPDQAVGLDPIGLKLMRWAMHSWERVRFLNTYLAGTWLPRIQLDVLPALKCAAHFALLGPRRAESVDDFLAAGAAMQRFWLTATHLGLQLQPEMTPLIFSWYVRAGKQFSGNKEAWHAANQLMGDFKTLIGRDTDHTVFFGRIGHGPAASARSTRLPLSQLMDRPIPPA
jgi:molybdopterin/thiamine biosynthesis adenylyltransferase/nitroreductase